MVNKYGMGEGHLNNDNDNYNDNDNDNSNDNDNYDDRYDDSGYPDYPYNNNNYTGGEIDISGNIIMFDLAILLCVGYSVYLLSRNFHKMCYRVNNRNNNEPLIVQRVTNGPVITISPEPVILMKKNYTTDIEDMESCPVCLDKYNEDEELVELDCHHYYHEKCIKDWLINNRSCPMCREDV